MQLPPILTDIQEKKQDAVMWLANDFWKTAGNDEYMKGTAVTKIAEVLALVGNSFVREQYVLSLAAKLKVNKKDLFAAIGNKIDEAADELEGTGERSMKLPDWVEDETEVYHYGFAERIQKWDTGYYFMNGSGGLTQQTNYVVTPLYHLYSQRAENNRRMLAVTNGITSAIVEMPSKGVLSADQWSSALYNEGTYLPKDGFGASHLRKLLNKISHNFVTCWELEQLGWQPAEGFFAFSNTTYRPASGGAAAGSMGKYNEYGVVQVDDKHFLSPSNSKANANVRASENIYENDLYLSYKEAPINFEQWCVLMEKVYKQAAWFAIPFAVATLFRDLVIKVTKLPHLYAYGAVGSGKSEYGESVSYLFFSGLNSQGELYKPFNLNQGTEFAFWNGMERFQNCPFVLNEFDENAIEDTRFRAIKSAYDSEGRAKGMKERNRATMQKVVCSIILLGQYLGTKDDNAVLMRSLPLAFKRDDNRTQQQIDDFTQLKKYERQGLSGILLELLDMRSTYEQELPARFAEERTRLAEDTKKEGTAAPERVIKNVALMVATVKMISERFALPYTTQAFYSYAKDFTIRMSNTISSTSGISEFWGMVEFLLDRGLIQEGKDFEIKTVERVTLTDEKTQDVRNFTSPKIVLFIRISNIHKLYLENYRKNFGKTGLNETTLMLYMKEQPYYLGWVKSHRFPKLSTTSCYAIEYDLLGQNLVREKEEEVAGTEVIVTAVVLTPALQMASDIWKFNIIKYSKAEGETTKTNTTIYTCFIHDPAAAGTILKDYQIQVKGMLTERQTGDRVNRTIEVIDFEAVPTYREFEKRMEVGKPTVRKDELPL